MSEIAGFHIARGCLAYGRVPQYNWDNLLLTARRIVALDGIGVTANRGSIIRTASCLGLDALLLSADSCDAWSDEPSASVWDTSFASPLSVCRIWRKRSVRCSSRNRAILSSTPRWYRRTVSAVSTRWRLVRKLASVLQLAASCVSLFF
jgi:tRNA G18 (ribose-2'-O)-methylase SpoU